MDPLSTIRPFSPRPETTACPPRRACPGLWEAGRAMGHRLRRATSILALLVLAQGAAPVVAADLQFGVVTPTVSILPLGVTLPLTTTGHFTDGTTRRLSPATIAAGGNHACVLETNGEIRCWGRGGSGQLGNGATADSSLPVTVASLVDGVALAAGGDSSCALMADGSLRCWGLNSSGQLGNGSTTASSVPVTVPGVSATAISAGFTHACAVLASGEVACWGGNAEGQLGNGSLVGTSSPVLVSGISTAVGVAAGGHHSCALLATGEVKCWGAGASGQLGHGVFAGSLTPVGVSGIDDAVAIDAGFDHACALIAGGALQCWGRGSEGQLGNGQFLGLPTPVDVVVGSERAVALGVGNTHGCAGARERGPEMLGAERERPARQRHDGRDVPDARLRRRDLDRRRRRRGLRADLRAPRGRQCDLLGPQ
jgi:hypothetical protein